MTCSFDIKIALIAIFVCIINKAACLYKSNSSLGLAMYNDSCVCALSICLHSQRPLPLHEPLQQSLSVLHDPFLPKQNSAPPLPSTHDPFDHRHPEVALQVPLSGISPHVAGSGPGPGPGPGDGVGGGDGVGPPEEGQHLFRLVLPEFVGLHDDLVPQKQRGSGLHVSLMEYAVSHEKGVVGALVGALVGGGIVGAFVGVPVVGCFVGALVVGTGLVGAFVGPGVGAGLGCFVGASVGALVGGGFVGALVGAGEGAVPTVTVAKARVADRSIASTEIVKGSPS